MTLLDETNAALAELESVTFPDRVSLPSETLVEPVWRARNILRRAVALAELWRSLDALRLELPESVIDHHAGVVRKALDLAEKPLAPWEAS